MVIKARKRTGWRTPKTTLKENKHFIINNCLEPQQYWDDWLEHRDGQRDKYNDRTKLKCKKLFRNLYPQYYMFKPYKGYTKLLADDTFNNRKKYNDDIIKREQLRRQRKQKINHCNTYSITNDNFN